MPMIRIASSPPTPSLLVHGGLTVVMFFGCVFSAATAQTASDADALPDSQRRALIRARDLVGDAAVKYRDGDFQASAEKLTAAARNFQKTLSAMDERQREKAVADLATLLDRIRTAHAMLQLEGVRLPPIRIGDGTRWWQDEVGGEELDQLSDAPEVAPEPVKAESVTLAESEEPDPPSEPQKEVSFVNDIAPILLDHCSGCHLETNRIRGGLRMDTFADLLRGGDEGDAIDVGSGEDSLIVMRMRGEGGDRMPAGGRPPVPADQIRLFSEWIDQGANDDGGSPTLPLRNVRLQAWAAQASVPERSERRREQSDQLIRLVTGTATIDAVTSDYFRVLGPLPQRVLERIGKVADAQMKTIAGMIPADPDRSPEAYFGGRATLFVLPRAYEYGEFARMVEERDLPPDWTSHFRTDAINAYVAVVAASETDDETIRDSLASPLIGLAMATRGPDVPEWLARGVGESLANARVRKQTRGQKAELLRRQRLAAGAAKDAGTFLQGRMPAEQTDALAIAIATAMSDGTRRRAFGTMIRSLNDGQAFEDSFAAAYGVKPDVFVDAYLKWVKGTRPTGSR